MVLPSGTFSELSTNGECAIMGRDLVLIWTNFQGECAYASRGSQGIRRERRLLLRQGEKCNEDSICT